MKKLLLALSLIVLPLTANITWDREKRIYHSTGNFLWHNNLNEQKYHQLALLFNQVIGNALIGNGYLVSHDLIDFIKFLRDECSPEAFVLSHDIDDFLEQFNEVD
jgi:hypothetical protein